MAIFKSKRFWLAVVGVISAAFGEQLPISQEQLTQIVMLIAAWIVGDSMRPTTTPETPAQ
jgi:hypothetical protein